MASRGDQRVIRAGDSNDIMEDDGVHDLLCEPQYNYSVVTRQRALIAWIGTGRKNDFNAVCKYYHFLEEHEDTLSREARLVSRSLEFNALPASSPRAEILQRVFPNLYTEKRNDRTESNAADSRGLALHSTETIIPASIAITNYLKASGRDMATFLDEFKDYTNTTGLASTLNNLLHYIENKSGGRVERDSAAVVESNESPDEALDDSLGELLDNESDANAMKPNNKTKENKNTPLSKGAKVKKSDAKLKYDEEEKENYDTKMNYADVAKNLTTSYL